MKQRRNKWISMFMAIAMLFNMLPSTISAEESYTQELLLNDSTELNDIESVEEVTSYEEDELELSSIPQDEGDELELSSIPQKQENESELLSISQNEEDESKISPIPQVEVGESTLSDRSKGEADSVLSSASQDVMDESMLSPIAQNEMILNFSDLSDEVIDTSRTVGENNFFTINATSAKKVEIIADNKLIDGFSFTKQFQFKGKGSESARSISFTVSNAATIYVYGISGSSSIARDLSLYKSGESTPVKTNSVGVTIEMFDFSVTEAGTYNLRSDDSGINIYYISVQEEGGEGVKKPWNEVADPIISDLQQIDDKMVVTVQLVTGDDGADSAVVIMTDEFGVELERKLIGKNPLTERVVDFYPTSSNRYKFVVYALRSEETDKISNTEEIDFVLPLTSVQITNMENKGNGTVLIGWNEVKEATHYEITYKKDTESTYSEPKTTTNLRINLTGLEIDSKYTIKVTAVRGTDKSEGTAEITTTAEAVKTWSFSAFGPSTNKTDNGFIENSDGTVSVFSKNGKGKFCQPIEPDGLAFYYTVMDAVNENFELSATVTVDSWKNSGGQDGFGLLVTDNIGIHGETTPVYNNMIANFISKVEYYWDSEKNKVSNAGTKISMKAGIGALEKAGATPTTHPTSGTSKPLELSCADMNESGGTYNIIGNYTEDPGNTVDNLTEFKLSIKRNNTGYYCTYYDADGKTVIGEQIFYDIERTKLSQIDSDNIYVGFFAARNAEITVSDICLNVTDPSTDPPAEERKLDVVEPSYKVISPIATGNSKYNFIYKANADGRLTVVNTKNRNKIVDSQEIKANTNFKKEIKLDYGDNSFQITFTPEQNYQPSEFEQLSDYGTKTFNHTVNYKTYGKVGESIYVSPKGTANGNGSKSSPLDIYTAVSYVRPGQMILLAGGTYNLTKTIRVERGIDGTAEQMIYMIGDPADGSRPVLDFGANCAGMILGGNYWNFKGFDVTNTVNMQKGIQISGNNSIFDQINTYYNGNTGIQISRLNTFDGKDEWPSNNLVLNCTSYGNADRGYEDADGFAAKLTVGEGNIFRGCIAHHNADDGWDLFAKVETGAIGKVTIDNCVAYNNGMLEDGTLAGNGNGFKMGGSNFTGYHELINSVAYGNKAKGIDSNSCPDIKVVNSTSYNNDTYNVAFYTNVDTNTDFSAEGIISFKSQVVLNDEENIKPRGNQDRTQIYNSTNYYWSGGKSLNADGDEVRENWFVSLDTGIKPSRATDGSILMNGLLELSANAPSNAGARIAATPSAEITPMPVIKDKNSSSSSSSDSAETVNGSDSASSEETEQKNDIVKIRPEITFPAVEEMIKNGTADLNVNMSITEINKAFEANKDSDKITIELTKEQLEAYISKIPDEAKTVAITIKLPIKTLESRKKYIENVVIPSELFESAISTNKEVVITFQSEDGMESIWSFDSELLRTTERKVDKVSLSLNLQAINNLTESKVKDLLKTDGKNKNGDKVRGIYASLGKDGLLPSSAEVKFKVSGISSSTGIKPGSKVYLYHWNKESGRLEELPVTEYKVDNKGYITVDITYCSDYVILPKKVSKKSVTSLVDQIQVKGLGTLYTNVNSEDKSQKNSVSIQTVLPNTLKKVNEFSTETKDKAVSEVKFTYKSSNKKVVTVSAKGKVTAKGKGNAIITVTAQLKNGEVIALKKKVKVAVSSK